MEDTLSEPTYRGYDYYYQKSMSYFPYEEPNSQQYQIIERIISLQDKQSLLMESPTGSGKTIASLCALLARKEANQKIVVFTRTISQIEPLLREWKLIIQKLRNEGTEVTHLPKMVPMLGKARLCKQLEIINKFGNFSPDGVDSLCKMSDCKLYPENPHKAKLPYTNPVYLSTKMNLSRGLSIDKVYQIYREIPACGYYKQKELIQHADVVVTSYPYLSEPMLSHLLKKMRIDIKNLLILVDEAHNLSQTSSYQVTTDQIEFIQVLIGEFPLLQRMINAMRSVSRIKASDLGSDDEWWQINNILTESNTERRQRMKITMWELNSRDVLAFARFYRVRFAGEINTEQGKMRVVIPTPARMLDNLDDAHIKVFQSGTFSPLQQYADMFGLQYAELLQTNNDGHGNKIKCFLNAYGLTSEYTKRKPWLFEKMAEVIYELYQVSPRHVMVISPSYAFQQQIYDYLLDFLEDRHEELELDALKQLIYKEERGMKSDSTLYSLKYSKTKSFLLGVASGKFSEGVEIVRNGGSMISTVVFAGLPFQRKSNDEGIIKGAIAKAAKDERAAQQFMRTIPLSRTVQQAFGRTVRQHLDKGALVILDYRAEKDLREELGLIKFISIEDVKDRLGKFFAGYADLKEV